MKGYKVECKLYNKNNLDELYLDWHVIAEFSCEKLAIEFCNMITLYSDTFCIPYYEIRLFRIKNTKGNVEYILGSKYLLDKENNK